MPKATSFKSVVVKEDPKTSLKEAGIYRMTLKDGMRAVAVGHMYFPHHDRNMVELVLQYLRDTKPAIVFLLGGIIDEDAFKSFGEDKENYLHDYPETAEVLECMEAGGFEEQVLALGEKCGEFISRFAEASGGKVIYIPSATHLSMPNEIRLMDWIQQTKRFRDSWAARNPDASDLPSNPAISLPKQLQLLFNLHKNPMVHVLRYNSGVLVNEDTLFMIGDFRRRHPGDASYVEWEQRGYNVVRSFDGKVASGWQSKAKHSLPGLTLDFSEFHEVGFLWDETRMGHLRDYDRRAPGFWTGVMVENKLFGQAVPIIRGRDCRRTFVIDGKPYTEPEATCLANGEEIPLAPRDLENHEHDDPRRPPAPQPPSAVETDADGNDEAGEKETKNEPK